MVDTTAENLKEAGLAHFRHGAYEDAITCFEAAVQAYEADEDVSGRAEMLNNIGVVRIKQRQFEAAVSALHEAQEAFAEIGDLDRQGQTLGNMGDLCAAQRRYQDAANHYSQAAQLFAQVADKGRQADVLRAYSLMALRRREVVTSINLMTDSLRVRPKRSIGQQIFYLMLRFVRRLMAGG